MEIVDSYINEKERRKSPKNHAQHSKYLTAAFSLKPHPERSQTRYREDEKYEGQCS